MEGNVGGSLYMGEQKQFNVIINIEERKLKILINGCLHLYTKEDKLIGVQSWVEGSCNNSYWIEYTFESGATVLSEYVQKERWKAILEALNKVL